MPSGIYNKSMGTLRFLKAIFLLLKDPKKAGGTALFVSVMATTSQVMINEVNAKHTIAMEKIQENTDKFHKMNLHQAQMLTTLEAIKKAVENTDHRLWELAQRGYALKKREGN